MTTIKLKQWVKFNGERLEPGTVHSNFEGEILNNLIDSGAAVYHYEASESERVVSPSDKVVITVEATENPNSLREELDENFTLDELKEDAQRFGIEFASAVTKKDLIAKIIKLEKAELFLNLLEDSE